MKAYTSANGRRFSAPWSASLRWVTWLTCAALLLAPVTIWVVAPAGDGMAKGIATAAGPLLIAATALFTVRGYRLEGRVLLVDRLLWSTRVPLEGLQRVEAAPDAMRRSIRLFGNGGLFAIAGWYRNRRLGSFRALATDPARSVVLHFPSRRIVVTPDDPQRFAQVVETRPG